VLHALASLAAVEKEESSKTVFYVLGGTLVAWAVLVSAVGIKRHDTFPSSPAAARAVMAISVVLVLGAMASAALTG
jgi:hypothetical protein